MLLFAVAWTAHTGFKLLITCFLDSLQSIVSWDAEHTCNLRRCLDLGHVPATESVKAVAQHVWTAAKQKPDFR